MKHLKKIGFFTVVALSLSMQGCIVAAIGAGVAAMKYGSSKQHATYNQYALGMEKINYERQKSGLKPEHVMTYGEYANNNH